MAAFLYRAAGSPAYTPPRVSPFRDVPTGHVFYDEMAWLAERGISTGWVAGDGSVTYRPGLDVTRGVMAAFLYRADLLRAGYGRQRMLRRGVPFRTDVYVVGDDLIWGATARILADLLARLPAELG